MRANMDFGDLIKDKRVIIIGAIVLLLLIIGGVVLTMNSSGSGDTGSAALPPPGSGPAVPPPGGGRPGAPIAVSTSGPGPVSTSGPGAVSTSGPGAPGAPGFPGGAPGGVPGAAATKVVVVPNSFAGAPPGMGGGTGLSAIAAGGGLPGGEGGLPGGGLPGGAGGGAAATGPKPAPITAGIVAPLARIDPFVPFYKLIVEAPPVYSLIVPQRLASRPTPTPLPSITDPDLKYGPLPLVERRVAGVLFDGSVSAILETGTPGAATTDVRVIQPGATVPSGVPTIADLTVASISPYGIVLRADDGRTATVKLSNVSAEFADSFHNAASGNGQGGGQPGGQPGGGPGGFGGGRPGGFNKE